VRPIYVPLFDSFFESSIMHEDVETRFVFLALIRLASRPRANGVVDIDPRMFAASINVPFDAVERAVRRLMEPDPMSGSKEHDGRRLLPVDPQRPMRGWQLVNWSKYSEMVHRVNDTIRKRESRADKTDEPDTQDKSGHVRTEQDETAAVLLAQTGRNGATRRNETIQYEKRKKNMAEKSFGRFWTGYPRRVKKPKALLAWKKLSPSDHEAAIERLKTFAWPEDPKFIPYPASWLNGREWEDEPTPPPATKPSPALVGSHGQTPEEMYRDAPTPTDEEIEKWEADAKRDIAQAYSAKDAKL
jgi:hypothetical protein